MKVMKYEGSFDIKQNLYKLKLKRNNNNHHNVFFKSES